MKEIPGLQTASLESFLFSLSKLLFLDFLVAGEAVTCVHVRARAADLLLLSHTSQSFLFFHFRRVAGPFLDQARAASGVFPSQR